LRQRWPAPIRIIHWATALLALVTIPAVYAAKALTEIDTDRAEMLVGLHIAIGLTILVLTLARIAARLVLARPPPALRPLWLRAAGAARSVAFYALLLALPMTGILKLTLSGLNVSTFGLVLIESGGTAPHVARALNAVHATLGKAFIALALLHAVLAVLHGRLFGANLLRRMV
jgi:cytochrome b561